MENGTIRKKGISIKGKIKCVVFDLDGTLAKFPIDYDSMRGELKELFIKSGKESSFKPLIQEIRRLAEEIGDENILQEAFKIIDKYEEKAVKNSQLIGNTIEFYNKCMEKGIETAILTRNGKKMVNLFLSKYNLKKPKVICSRDDSVLLKPDPAQFEIIEKKTNFKKEEYLLLGNSEHDRELARNVSIRFINPNKPFKIDLD